MRHLDIPIDQLSVSPLNSRKNLSAGQEDSDLGDLVANIRERSVITPLVVRPLHEGRYEIVAGQRRFSACRQIGLSPIPCIVHDNMTDSDAEAISLIENVQRADLHPLDKARALKALYDRYNSYSRVSQEVGLSRPTIEKYILLLSLPSKLQQRLGTKEGALGVGTMAKLAKTFKGDEAIEVFDKISGFKQTIQQEIIQRSNGDLEKIDEIVEEAQEGVFDVRRCGGSRGCEIIREIIEGELSSTEFQELIGEAAKALGVQLGKRKAAARQFWKALARN
jgi:ParB/RepB/Spo0J family partition protein